MAFTGAEEVRVPVVKGEIHLVAPADTPRSELLHPCYTDKFLSFDLELEGGWHLSGYVCDGADGVDLRIEPLKKPEPREPVVFPVYDTSEV